MSEEQNNQENNFDNNEEKRVKLYLEGGMGFKTTVLAKQKTCVSKLLKAFCKEHNVEEKEHRLFYKSKILDANKRIEDYNIPEEGVISVVASQVGGNYFK